jgi:hypothetical protein
VAGNELDEWARRVALLPAALVEGTPQAVQAGAQVFGRALERNLRVATGGDMRLSRVRSGRGAAVSVAVKVLGAGRSARGEAVPRGPVMLIDQGSRGHRQPFVYTYNRRVRKRGGGVIRIPGRGVFARVQHPGTRGKRVVARSFTEAHEEAGAAGVAVFSSIVTEFLAQGRWNRQALGLGE